MTSGSDVAPVALSEKTESPFLRNRRKGRKVIDQASTVFQKKERFSSIFTGAWCVLKNRFVEMMPPRGLMGNHRK